MCNSQTTNFFGTLQQLKRFTVHVTVKPSLIYRYTAVDAIIFCTVLYRYTVVQEVVHTSPPCAQSTQLHTHVVPVNNSEIINLHLFTCM